MARLSTEKIWEFAEALKQTFSTPSDTRAATVQSVDNDGTVWVVYPGASSPTPIASVGAAVEPGDYVYTQLLNGRLVLTTNKSDPAIGGTKTRAIVNAITQPIDRAVVIAKGIADEAKAVANAINQHFWDDDNGAHVTDVTQDEWKAAVDDGFSDYDADTKPYHNLLMNSLGILLRTALNNLVSITRSAIAFYDGAGNAASNIVARFGSDGAQIGKSGAAHSVIDADGQRFYASNGTTQLANIGYGEGAAQSGTAVAPYYTFGTRANGSAIGNLSVAEGDETTASHYTSHAEGSYTTASGSCSHAEGGFTTASADNSHAEGDDTTASGYCSHAEGYETTASGLRSHAQNRGTIAASEAQTAMGKYNAEDTADKYALIIGNGTSDNARSNAATVSWAGDIEAAGDITDGGGNTLADKLDASAAASSYLPLAGGTITGDLAVDGDIVTAQDIQWTELPLASGWVAYSTGWTPRYRRSGNVVQVKGAVKPTAAQTIGDTGITFATLPNGCRPSGSPETALCQASGTKIWLLNIETSGVMTAARMRTMNSTSYQSASTSEWMTFDITFLL